MRERLRQPSCRQGLRKEPCQGVAQAGRIPSCEQAIEQSLNRFSISWAQGDAALAPADGQLHLAKGSERLREREAPAVTGPQQRYGPLKGRGRRTVVIPQ